MTPDDLRRVTTHLAIIGQDLTYLLSVEEGNTLADLWEAAEWLREVNGLFEMGAFFAECSPAGRTELYSIQATAMDSLFDVAITLQQPEPTREG